MPVAGDGGGEAMTPDHSPAYAFYTANAGPLVGFLDGARDLGQFDPTLSKAKRYTWSALANIE
jgi:hypothetical protein